MNIVTTPDSVLQIATRRHGPHARRTPAHRDGRAHPPPACLRPGSAADRGRVRAGARIHRRASARPPARRRTRWCWPPTCWASRRWSRCSTTRTRRANRRPRCSAPSGAPMRRCAGRARRSRARARRAFRSTCAAWCATRKARPVAGATVDVWQASPVGLYENQDPEQDDMNLRGRFETDAEGRYHFRTRAPGRLPGADRRAVRRAAARATAPSQPPGAPALHGQQAGPQGADHARSSPTTTRTSKATRCSASRAG